MGNLRYPVLTVHIYSKVRIGFRGRCWAPVQYKITTKIRRLKGSNAESLQPPWPIPQQQQHPKDNSTHYARWRPTRTTSFRRCQTAATAGILKTLMYATYTLYHVPWYILRGKTDFFLFSCFGSKIFLHKTTKYKYHR